MRVVEFRVRAEEVRVRAEEVILVELRVRLRVKTGWRCG